jgi:hypothetical protein
MHPTLNRLDDLADALADDDGLLAVLGLGSAGVEHNRFDDHSDIDFWLVVSDSSAKQRYLDGTGWLAGLGGTLVHSFVNDPNGRKALLADGLFLEYAVFTPEELNGLALTGAAWCGNATAYRSISKSTRHPHRPPRSTRSTST